MAEPTVQVTASGSKASEKLGDKALPPSAGNADPTKIETSGYSELANSRQLELMRWLKECFTRDAVKAGEDAAGKAIMCNIFREDEKKGDTNLMTEVQLEAVQNLNQLIMWQAIARKNPASGEKFKLMALMKHYGTKSIVELAELIAISSEEMRNRTEGLGMMSMVMGKDRSKRAFGFEL